MKEKRGSHSLGVVVGSFLEEPRGGFKTLTLGKEDRQVLLSLFDNSSVAIYYRIGSRVADQISPVTFDKITSWKLKKNHVLFRRQMKSFDETLKISFTGEYTLGPTKPSDWTKTKGD